MTTSEKVAYLKGLTEGLGINKESKEGKILAVVMDILEDVALDIEDLEQNAWDLGWIRSATICPTSRISSMTMRMTTTRMMTRMTTTRMMTRATRIPFFMR